MSVSLKKIDGVQSAEVTLNTGQARIMLKPGNKVRLSDIRRAIVKNGFTPQGAQVSAEAEIQSSPGRAPQVRVSGTGEMFPIADTTPAALLAEIRRQAGQRVIVEGSVQTPKEDPTGALKVTTVTAVAR